MPMCADAASPMPPLACRPPPLPGLGSGRIERSRSAPVSPASPPWTPPVRRRIASAEAATSWLDVHLVVDVIKRDQDGCREVHCYVHVWDRTTHFAIPLRRLLFWLLFCLLLLPTGAFRMLPRMPGMAFQAPAVSPTMLAVPTRLSRFNDSHDHSSLAAAAGGVASYWDSESMMSSAPVAEILREEMLEDFDQCILDASTDGDLMACLEQAHSSTVDELSGVIVKEGCELLSSADDGTVVGLLGQVLHTIKAEGGDAIKVVTIRRMALRACVSAAMHKITVCALPALSACMLHAPEALQSLASLGH